MILKNFKIEQRERNVLLINPPVYDVSDFKLEYCQPVGLLKISTLLREAGANVELIDCLEDIDNRNIVYFHFKDDISIPVYQFGMSFSELRQRLSQLSFQPDEIYLTVFATYWYKSATDTIKLCRSIFPKAKIITGGIYPTLMPEHADNNLGADIVVRGEVQGANNAITDMNHYPNPKYLGLKPSRGCPHNCGYCAQRIINDSIMKYQNPTKIVDEIEKWHHEKEIQSFYIFSENFLYNEGHFSKILNGIIEKNLNIKLFAQKGMESRLLNPKILAMMKEAGWVGIRLALETKSKEHRMRLGRMYNDQNDYERAIRYAIDADFSPNEIGTFLLYGTPEESLYDIKDSAEYISSFGGYIIPMAFTPVPGSKIYNEYSEYLKQKDLSELIGRLYPFAEINHFAFEEYINLEKFFTELNRNTGKKNDLKLDFNWIEKSLNGAFVRSEMAFAMDL